MSKKKKKNKNRYYDERYDYSELHYQGDVKKMLNKMADSFEEFLQASSSYFIFEGVKQSKYKKEYDTIKKLIKDLRKGDITPLNIEAVNDLIDNGYSIMSGQEFDD